MSKTEIDILVAGGGIAGQIATLALAQAGFDVICVEPAAPGTDLRSTAFLNPAVQLLEDIGAFAQLSDVAAPLHVMRLCDAGGEEPEVRETVDFEAEATGATQFGWNIPNAPLRLVLSELIASEPRARMITGASVEAVTPRSQDAIVRLTSGKHIAARLVIGADGRNSALRQSAGITAKRIDYAQTALVFHAAHPLPHDGVSTEIHRSGGPFTLVPLHDPHKSAVVWMETAKNAEALMQLDDVAFAQAATTRSCAVQGALSLASGRGAFPVISQRAARLTAQRCALIAEAAHVVPPIGAQGLNMSLADITVLRDLITGANDPGAAALLQSYERARMPQIALRIAGVDALNRAAMAQAPGLRDLRVAGLRLLGQGPLKGAAMRAGLG